MKTFKTIITEATEARMRRINASIERKTQRVLQGPSFDEYMKLVNSTDKLGNLRDRLENRYNQRTANIGAEALRQHLDTTAPLTDVQRIHRQMSKMSDEQLSSRLSLMGQLIRNDRRTQGLSYRKFNDRRTNPNVDRLNFRGNKGTGNN
jgi:hypothetical protein